ncbi:DNA cytosine methyltransferase [Hahella ganghwensis]|uniref:DNA cytosine methyltransferase n=1 Tax=Hahella ganghwensis TaxID=286420 RepID=UPI00037FFCD0|nr:DNA cytosine methyltransferase [Hahella ganghwensis]
MTCFTNYRNIPQLGLGFEGELIIDNFAGGGGASTGIEIAVGRPVDIAINHDPEAVEMHKINHPVTEHYCEDVWQVDPRKVCAGRPVGLAWFSPDCKHHSKAKGGKPREKKIRGLAWVAIRWAATVKPRVICLENVEEFIDWGPLDQEGFPCKRRKGRTFKSFVRALKRQGYRVEYRQLRACDYGTPTIRKRLFLVARCDDAPIVWPKVTHGDPNSEAVKSRKLKPWLTAADIIDWSIPCPSIFERNKPLAENTLKRIAKGIQRFVVDSPNPFIVKVNHGGEGFRGQRESAPLHTLTSKNGAGIVIPSVAPFITEHANASNQRNMAANDPLRTQCAEVKGGHFAMVSAFLAKHYTGVVGSEIEKPTGTVTTVDHHSLVTAHIQRDFGQSVGSKASDPVGTVMAGGQGKTQLVSTFLSKYFGKSIGSEADDPLHTVPTRDSHALVTSNLVKLRGTCRDGQRVDAPLPTVTAGGNHVGEVRAFLMKYYSEGGQWAELTDPMHTIPTKDRIGLVVVKGELYRIVDIGMRMLQPHELYRAQGFPSDYIHDRLPNGKKLSKAAQVRMCGNSVCPPLAAALVAANFTEQFGQQQEPTEAKTA